jgi:hypothetical protein
MTRYPMYRTLGGQRGWSERERKILLPKGFDPRTVDTVTSHLTEVLLKIPILRGRENLLLSYTFPTLRKIVVIYFPDGILAMRIREKIQDLFAQL